MNKEYNDLKNELYNVSSSQKRLYALYESNKEDISYNISCAIETEEYFDAEIVKNIIKKLVKRHESLRTIFTIIDGQIKAKILQEDNMNIQVTNFDGTKGDIDTIIKNFIKPFDLGEGPLFRIGLIKFSKKNWMIFDVHHIIADGASLHFLMDEFITLYRSETLTELKIQYKDYAKWQMDFFKSEKLMEQKKYWLNEFNGDLPVLNLTYDFLRPEILDTNGDRVYFKIDKNKSKMINDIAKTYISTPYIVLFAAYYILLAKYSNQEDIIVGSVFHGRTCHEFRNTIGMFVNTLAIRNNPRGAVTFTEFLIEVRNKLLNIKKNQDYQFDMLLEDLKIKREANRNPLFDTMFVFENMRKFKSQGTSFKMAPYKINNGIAKFDITLFAEEVDDGISFELEYRTSLFKEDSMERLCRHYTNIVDIITSNPFIRISDIVLLSEEERKTYIYDFNNTKMQYPNDKTVTQLFDNIADEFPNSIAVEFEGEILTYKALKEKSNKFARYLIKQGVKQEYIIPIIIERSPEFIISALGVLKSGAAFLPVDNIYPKERIEYMVNDCRANFLITNDFFENNFQFNGRIINIKSHDWEEENCKDIEYSYYPSNAAYIIYTSGSTGNPKGVVIGHRNLTNYICWAAKVYEKNKYSSFPLYTSVSFDLTITSIFLPLLLGGSIVVYKENDKDILIRKVILDNKVDIIKLTPSHLKLIADMDCSRTRVKVLIVGGENLEVDLAQKVYEAFHSNVDIFNEYGPTETTVGCMIHKYNYKDDRDNSVPIGRPADNTFIYLLDKYLNPVPVNVEGEINISGDGVAKGYLNRAEITREKFLPNPFLPGCRMYKTGDIGKMLPCGDVEYIGRIDQQVKIRGYRIETGEIEKNLLSIDNINDAVVLVGEDKFGNKSLYAYLISDKVVSDSEIRNALSLKLPSYMIPSYYFQVDKFPLTQNGKLDNKALLKLEKREDSLQVSHESSNEMEIEQIKIWGEILGTPGVGVDDNYFTLGGDSIKAIQIVSKLNNLNINISIKDILTYQTIREISKHVNRNVIEYNQGIVEGEVNLNPIQIWFFGHNFNNPNYYNQSVTVKFKQDIDIIKLEETFKALVKLHDALRLNYNAEKNNLFFNNNHLDERFEIKEYSIANLSDDKQKKEIERIGTNVKSGFDITKDLLIKAVAITLNDNSKTLVITVHHLVVDGVSWRIIIEDIYNIYSALLNGEEIVLPKKTASVRDWYNRIVEYLDNEISDEELQYWKKMNNGDSRPKNQHYEYESEVSSIIEQQVYLDKEITGYLTYSSNRAYNTKTIDLLITALLISMKEFTSISDIRVELESYGRNLDNINVSRTVGWFTMMYPVLLKTDVENLDEQIKYVKETLRNVPNDGFGYGVIKYMKEKSIEFNNIRFNYLGEFGSETENDLFKVVELPTGRDVSTKNHITTDIEINCMIINGILSIKAVFNKLKYNEIDSEKFILIFKQKLEEVIKYTAKLEDVYFTPSDFETADIDQQDIDMLFQ